MMILDLDRELETAINARKRILEKGQASIIGTGDQVTRSDLEALNRQIQRLRMEIQIRDYPII